MKNVRIWSFVLSVAMALTTSQAMARIGDPPKQQPTKSVTTPAPAKKADSSSKGSFGMASNGGNSRSDLAAQVKAREDAQKQAQQNAARKAQEDAQRAQAAKQQQHLLAQQQAEQARVQRAQAAEQARIDSLRAQQAAQLNAQREAQRLADQSAAQARLIREQQRTIAAQQDAMRYRTNPTFGSANGGYVSAEEAARRARNGTLAGAAGGAAVGGVVGYEMGKHSADGNVQVQQGQVYTESTPPIVPPVVAQAPITTPAPVPVVVREQSSNSSGSGFGWFVVGILVAGGVGYFVYRNMQKNGSNSVPASNDAYQAPPSNANVVQQAAAPVEQAYDNRPAQNAELIQDIVEFFTKLQAYYNAKNAEALTALTSSQMLTSIKEAFVTGGHVVTDFSNIYVSLEEVKDAEVSALIEADARETVDGEVSEYRLREIWTMKREAFGLVLDGITRLD